MLRHRVIPIVLIDGFSVLKTIHFKQRRNLGSPITVARTYNTRNVDELVLLDIDASKQGRSIDLFTIQDIARELFMPLTIGGGIRSTDDIERALASGADKVALNDGALRNPELIRKAANLFGSQCIVVSVDVVKRHGVYQVYSHSDGTSAFTLLDYVKRAEVLGAGEILINDVDRDGTMSGMNIELISNVAGAVSIPIIAAGGVSGPRDCATAIKAGASAVGVSSIFHFTNVTPNDCKLSMREQGIPVRL